jgi:hypothetical protein
MRQLLVPLGLACSAFFLSASGQAGVPSLEPAPGAAKQPATDDYGGITVKDDYRWMEQFSDPKVKAWAQKQND